MQVDMKAVTITDIWATGKCVSWGSSAWSATLKNKHKHRFWGVASVS